MKTITYHMLRDRLSDLAKFQKTTADFIENSPAKSYDYADEEGSFPHQLREEAKENERMAGEGFHLVVGDVPQPIRVWCVPRLNNNTGEVLQRSHLFVVAEGAPEALEAARLYLIKTEDNSRLGNPGMFDTFRPGVIHDQIIP